MLKSLLLKDKTQVISNEIAMQPGSRKLIKTRGDCHTIFAPFTKKGFVLLLLGSVCHAGLPTRALAGQEDHISPDKLRCVNGRKQCASACMDTVSLASSLQGHELLISLFIQIACLLLKSRLSTGVHLHGT